MQHKSIGGFPTAWEAGVAVAQAYAEAAEKKAAARKSVEKAKSGFGGASPGCKAQEERTQNAAKIAVVKDFDIPRDHTPIK